MKQRSSPPNYSLIAGGVLTISVASVAIFHATTNVLLLINISAMLIVFGGLAASCIVMFPVHEIMDLLTKVTRYLRFRQDSMSAVAAELIQCTILHSREKTAMDPDLIQNRRIRDAIEILRSGLKRDDVLTILRVKKETTANQTLSEAALLLSLAKLAPGYGLVGTLVGLVVLLYDMGSGNFDKVGPAMAIALVATLYGVLAANMIFMPLAEFITHRAEHSTRMDELIEQVVLGMMEGKHPIQLREYVRAHLSQNEQGRLEILLAESAESRRAATSEGMKEAEVA